MSSARHIPGAGKRHWWLKKVGQEAAYSIPPVAAAALVAKTLAPAAGPVATLTAYGVVVWLVGVAIIRVAAAHEQDTRDDPGLVHEGLNAIVVTLHEMMSAYYANADIQANIRVTFHRVVPPIDKPVLIEQIVPYAGWPSDGTGRTFPVATGITGRAIRTKLVVTMSSSAGSTQEHHAELVREWGYTEEAASKLTQGRFSAMAIPVLDTAKRNTLGVLYLDSDNPAAFGDKARVIAILGSQVINRFVTKRYKL